MSSPTPPGAPRPTQQEAQPHGISGISGTPRAKELRLSRWSQQGHTDSPRPASQVMCALGAQHCCWEFGCFAESLEGKPQRKQSLCPKDVSPGEKDSPQSVPQNRGQTAPQCPTEHRSFCSSCKMRSPTAAPLPAVSVCLLSPPASGLCKLSFTEGEAWASAIPTAAVLLLTALFWMCACSRGSTVQVGNHKK